MRINRKRHSPVCVRLQCNFPSNLISITFVVRSTDTRKPPDQCFRVPFDNTVAHSSHTFSKIFEEIPNIHSSLNVSSCFRSLSLYLYRQTTSSSIPFGIFQLHTPNSGKMFANSSFQTQNRIRNCTRFGMLSMAKTLNNIFCVTRLDRYHVINK